MKNNKPIYAFNHYEDLYQIKDSVQLESGTVIATLETLKCFVSLEVRGDVKIFWDPEGLNVGAGVYGECYCHPLEFCDELKELIETNNRWWEDPRVYISENNWFELFIGKDKSDPIPVSEVVDVEGYTSEDIEKLMLECIENDENHKTFNEPEIKEYKIPVEWTVTENISVEAISLEKAIEWTREHADEIPCLDGEYVAGSWKISCDKGQSAKELAKHIKSWGGVFDR